MTIDEQIKALSSEERNQMFAEGVSALAQRLDIEPPAFVALMTLLTNCAIEALPAYEAEIAAETKH